MKLYEELLKSRIILLNEEINVESANRIKLELLYLDSISNEDIYLYIDSPGGMIIEGLAIIDCMNHIKSKVSTICFGSAYSMAAIILACGEKGMRKSLPHSEIMIHEASSGVEGKTKEVVLYAKRLATKNKNLSKILAEVTKKDYKKIYEDMKSDFFMSPANALSYGIIDEII